MATAAERKRKAAAARKKLAAKKKTAPRKKAAARIPKPKKVLIATPAYDGRLDVWYCNALVNTIRLAQANNIILVPVFMSYDALVQRARNDLVALAVQDKFDAMIFIDSDMEWDPSWVLELLARKEHIVGGCARKKTDNEEVYTVKTEDTSIHKNGMMKCDSIGTGFVKLSKKAILALWNVSEPYTNEGKESRMCFDVSINNAGELCSEDTTMFSKLIMEGFDVWWHPAMTLNHTGVKKFEGNFLDYVNRLQQEAQRNM